MSQNEQNSVITMVSGMCGGLGKAFSSSTIIASVSIGSIAEVALYAAVSAIVGYGMKVLIDRIKRSFRK